MSTSIGMSAEPALFFFYFYVLLSSIYTVLGGWLLASIDWKTR